MTLDEAIKHAEEVAEQNEGLCERIHPAMQLSDYSKCAEEHRQLAEWLKELKRLREQTRWIPVKTRPLTEEEKEEYADLGYGEDSVNFMYDCPLPEDGEEVIITTRYGKVAADMFFRDDGCYFETYCDEDDVKAWMPLPETYKAESEDEE